MTKAELQVLVAKQQKQLEEYKQRMTIAEDNAEVHKKASYEQAKKDRERQKEFEVSKMQYEKLSTSYNNLAKIFDEYMTIGKNTLSQLQGLTKASVMLEKHITQKIKNFNEGVEEK